MWSCIEVLVQEVVQMCIHNLPIMTEEESTTVLFDDNFTTVTAEVCVLRASGWWASKSFRFEDFPSCPSAFYCISGEDGNAHNVARDVVPSTLFICVSLNKNSSYSREVFIFGFWGKIYCPSSLHKIFLKGRHAIHTQASLPPIACFRKTHILNIFYKQTLNHLLRKEFSKKWILKWLYARSSGCV